MAPPTTRSRPGGNYLYSKKASPPVQTQPDLKSYPDVKVVVETNNQFATQCTNLLRTAIPGNLTYSPFYLRILVGMAKLGARGPTFEEIQNAFYFPPTDLTFSQGNTRILTSFLPESMKGIQLLETSCYFMKKGFEITMEFAEDLLSLYKTEVHSVDFSDSALSASLINSCFEKATNSQVKFVVNPASLNQYTRLLFVNAIYFNGDWRDKFERKKTKKGIFHVSEKKEVEVDMMVKRADVLYADFSELDARIISMPYQCDRLHLIIILPNTIASLPSLKKDVSFDAILKKLSGTATQMEVTLPKFRLESTLHFIQPLKQLGVKTAFDPTVADFSGITGYTGNDLYVSEIIQKVVFECAEDDGTGMEVDMLPTILTAATGKNKRAHSKPKQSVTVGGYGQKGKPVVEFQVNHPFLFAFVDRLSGAILFSGAVANPNKN